MSLKRLHDMEMKVQVYLHIIYTKLKRRSFVETYVPGITKHISLYIYTTTYIYMVKARKVNLSPGPGLGRLGPV